MLELMKAMNQTQDALQAVQNYTADAVVQEQCRAAMQAYTRKLELNREYAEAFLREHKEINDQIFAHAEQLFRLSVTPGNANVQLARCAAGLLKVLTENQAEYRKEYLHIMFRK